QGCVHSPGLWKLVVVYKNLESLCPSPARDLAPTSDVTMFSGTVRHAVAISSGCLTLAAPPFTLPSAPRWCIEPQPLETMTMLWHLYLYTPYTPTTQPATFVPFTQQQEMLLSFNRNTPD
ncbi:hypothetical protein CIB84_016414, partial [Bambusicola thoracicus]